MPFQKGNQLRKGVHLTGDSNGMFGRHHSLKSRKKMRIAKLGKLSNHSGKRHTLECRERIRQGHIGIKQSPEQIRKRLSRRPMSNLEIKSLGIIQKMGLPYKFVGNGEFFVGRKCPDFVNCNGEKIAVEVYYRRHKDMFSGGLENWKKDRQKIFSEYGWKIIFFDETQVNEESFGRLL